MEHGATSLDEELVNNRHAAMAMQGVERHGAECNGPSNDDLSDDSNHDGNEAGEESQVNSEQDDDTQDDNTKDEGSPAGKCLFSYIYIYFLT